MSQPAYAERRLAEPQDWSALRIKGFEQKLSDGTRVKVPYHSIKIAHRYPTDESGKLVAGMTQAQSAEFLKGTEFRYPILFQDEAVRDRYGRKETAESGHPMFDENYGRDTEWRWGYVPDFTRPNSALKPVEGVGDQMIVHRELFWMLPEGEVLVGPVTMAPGGMVPRLSRRRLEKLIGKEGLKRLEELRGREIYEKGSQIVVVRDYLGVPQRSLGHDARDENGEVIPHNHHFYAPSQDAGEAVGVHGAHWFHHGGRWCFLVDLGVGAAYSNPYGSFPLVRGGEVEAKIIPAKPERRAQL